MNLEPIRALLELAEKATPGPWELNTTTWHNGALLCHVGHGEGGWSYLASLNMNMRYLLGKSGEEQAKDNAAFLISARNSVPALSQLLEAVTNLEKLEADLRTKMGDYQWSAYLHCANEIKRLLHPEDK